MIEGLPTEALAFLIGIAAAIGIIIFVPVLKLVLDIAAHSYANTRVSAMNGALIKKRRYSELVDVNNIEEFVGMLEGTPYSEFLGKMGVSVGENAVEEALEKEYASEKEKIIKILPDSIKKIMAVYFKREEAMVIKNIMRKISSGFREFEGIEPVGKINANRISSLIEADSVKEFVARLEGTEYYEAMNTALGEYENGENLIYLERAIDKYVMDKIWNLVAYAGVPLMQEFIGREIDVQNIMLSLRAKVDGIKGNELEKYVINGGYELNEKKVKEIIDSESVHDVVSLLEGTGYGKILSEAMPKYEGEGLSVFEDGLRRYRYAISKDFAAQVLNTGPVIAYLIRKENEVTNLKTIMKCKSINMDKDKIESLLVV